MKRRQHRRRNKRLEKQPCEPLHETVIDKVKRISKQLFPQRGKQQGN